MRADIPLAVLAILFALPLEAAEKLIPAAARAFGANGTFFRSDVHLVNLSSELATVDLTWLPTATDNSAAATIPLIIAPRASIEIADVLGSLFGVSDGIGALRLSSSSAFVASSRTYTPSDDCPGTFGQFIPAVDAERAAARSVIAAVQIPASLSSGARTNIGLVNPAAASVEVRLHLRSGNGALAGTTTLTVPPFGHLQRSAAELFPSASQATSAFVEVDGSGPLLAYASVIDNQSGDSIFVPAEMDPHVAEGVEMIARQWVFEPEVIEVESGELVTLRVRAIDVEHGISFSGVGPFTCSSEQAGQCILRPGETVTVTFTPSAKGSFAFFCTRFCGESADALDGHETMRGTIIVR